MSKDKEIAFKYTKGAITKYQNLEHNPNGSDHDIAGVLAYNGRVLGMMPHPERAMFSHQSPLWQMNKKFSKKRAGLQIFKNAINYFKKQLVQNFLDAELASLRQSSQAKTLY